MTKEMELISDCLTGFTLPTCFVCSALTKRKDRICTLCWNQFAKRAAKQCRMPKVFKHPKLKKVRVRYLFDWYPDADPALSKLLVGLKGGVSPETWPKLAKEFVAHHFADLHLEDAMIIPIPSRKLARDHAENWGRALADITKVPFENPLKHLSTVSQKELPIELREFIQFDLEPTVDLGSTIVIVDDILTTGSTTKAAIDVVMKSVKPPKTLEIWTVARRHRLAP